MARPIPSERDLVCAAKQADGTARDALVNEYLPVVGGVARLYASSTVVSHEELLQAGIVGLLRALGRYDPSLGTPFWAYASWWVRQAMQRLVAELERPVVLSDRALRDLARLRTVERESTQRDHRAPTTAELAAKTGMSRRHVDRLLAVRRAPRWTAEPDTDPGRAWEEQVVDEAAQEAFARVETRVDAQALFAVLATRLTERERLVLRARYGLDGPEQTLRRIAETLGVSAERVRQIEREALDKLRDGQRVPAAGQATTGVTAGRPS